MTEATVAALRAAGAQLHLDRLRAEFEAQLSDEALALWQLAGSMHAVAPHGGFNIHTNDTTRGPNNQLAVYVICACGRGYSWELKMPGEQLLTWLANHGDDIPLEEEARRVKATGADTTLTDPNKEEPAP